jgi:hypothetical protein
MEFHCIHNGGDDDDDEYLEALMEKKYVKR